ncbi:hypothetical protein JCM3774_004608 [Rhodotorula dairenensis]
MSPTLTAAGGPAAPLATLSATQRHASFPPPPLDLALLPPGLSLDRLGCADDVDVPAAAATLGGPGPLLRTASESFLFSGNRSPPAGATVTGSDSHLLARPHPPPPPPPLMTTRHASFGPGPELDWGLRRLSLESSGGSSGGVGAKAKRERAAVREGWEDPALAAARRALWADDDDDEAGANAASDAVVGNGLGLAAAARAEQTAVTHRTDLDAGSSSSLPASSSDIPPPPAENRGSPELEPEPEDGSPEGYDLLLPPPACMPCHATLSPRASCLRNSPLARSASLALSCSTSSLSSDSSPTSGGSYCDSAVHAASGGSRDRDAPHQQQQQLQRERGRHAHRRNSSGRLSPSATSTASTSAPPSVSFSPAPPLEGATYSAIDYERGGDGPVEKLSVREWIELQGVREAVGVWSGRIGPWSAELESKVAWATTLLHLDQLTVTHRSYPAVASRLCSPANSMAEDETTPLLSGEGATEPQSQDVAGTGAVEWSASFIIIPYFLFALFSGACATVEIEAIGQLACRLVVPVPVPSSTTQDRLQWEAMCRVAPDVLKKTSSVVTEILLVAGILSALTAAWWGGVSDRRGRRIVLGTTSVADMATNGMMLLVLTWPDTFGYPWLLFSAVIAGITGGQLASLAIGATYLSDIATPEKKTQILSLYEAANFGGMAIGPLVGPYMMRIRGLGVTAPYVGLLVARLLFILLLPLMPETLPARTSPNDTCGDMRSPSDEVESKPARFVSQFLAAPVALLQPFRVLVPEQVNGRRSYQLPLIAASYALLMIVPGLGPVKIIYARGTFGWGPVETGRFITYTSAVKIVVLLGLVPLASRVLRKTVQSPRVVPEPDPSSDNIAEGEQDADPLVTSVWDLALAKTAISFALVGYLVMLIPTHSQKIPFMVGTGFTAFASAAPPALLSLALAFSRRDDAGKVLASLSALATISVTAIGPSVFGAVYVAVLKWWSEFVFLLAALWVASSLIPLFCIRLSAARHASPDVA